MDRSRTLPQIKVLVCGKSLAPDSARLSLDRRLPTVSLRIEGDWRADHAGDVVDTEPKMAKAVLVAGGGFIPDEDRILGPADRPGRPPVGDHLTGQLGTRQCRNISAESSAKDLPQAPTLYLR